MAEPNDTGKQGEETPDEARRIEITQEKLDALVDKAYARGAKNSRDAKEVESMRQELEELRKLKVFLEEAAKKQPKPKTGESDEDAEARYNQRLAEIKGEYEKRLGSLETQQAEKESALQAQIKSMRSESLKADIVSQIAGQARDPEEVFILMQAKGYFQENDETGRFEVIDPKTKKVRLDVDADGEPLSPGKAAVEWLEEHPSHKRGSGRTGSGQGSGSDAGGEAPSADVDTSKMRPSEIFAKRHEIIAGLRRG